jgi:hypothetical protein
MSCLRERLTIDAKISEAGVGESVQIDLRFDMSAM